MTYREGSAERNRAPSPRRARRTPSESREQLLRAATTEFVSHGFAGARISRIVKKAGSNPRMIYHYFGSKSQLYVAVLGDKLGTLRRRELQIDVEHLDPQEGLLQLFDFMAEHFERDQHLVRLLSAENLLKAKYMRMSSRISRNVISGLGHDRAIDRTRQKNRSVGSGVGRPSPLCPDGVAIAVSFVERAHTVDDLRPRPLGAGVAPRADAGRKADVERLFGSCFRDGIASLCIAEKRQLFGPPGSRLRSNALTNGEGSNSGRGGGDDLKFKKQ